MLSRDQRQSMLTQERGNFVLWAHRNRAENTDPIHIPEQYRENHENADEESPTEDETISPLMARRLWLTTFEQIKTQLFLENVGWKLASCRMQSW